MYSKSLLLLLALASPSWAFVHISELKPRLNVSPENPVVTFHWSGEAPRLSSKEQVFDGAYADADDSEMMEKLLQTAMEIWNEVPSSYLSLRLARKDDVSLDQNDDNFSIVVEEQDSKTVAAAAMPVFLSAKTDSSGKRRNPHIIYDCDISIGRVSVTAKAMLRAATHELGHCLGLGHPHGSYRSIMSYSTMSESSALSLDDKAVITFLYPEPSQSEDVEYLTSCGLVGARPLGTWPVFFYLAPLSLVYGYRFCRRRR